jgi:hypothetical protein
MPRRRRRMRLRQRPGIEDRLREAVSILGGSHANLAWRFPLPVAERHSPLAATAAHWDRIHGGAARARLHEYLVRRIRQWRPEVILTEPVDPRGTDPLAQRINQTVLSAVEAAGDPLAETDQALVTGLTPWKVKKVFSSEGPEQSGLLNLTTAQLAPRLGTSLADQATLGRQLLDSRHRWPARTLGFRLLQNQVSGESGRQDFFSGIPMQPGSPTRRELHSPPPTGHAGDQPFDPAAPQRRTTVAPRCDFVAPRSSLAGAGREPDPRSGRAAGAQVLFELAQSLQRAGQLDLAADVYDHLLRRFPDDPLCESAVVWLIQFSSSREARWAFRRTELIRPRPHRHRRRLARWSCRRASFQPVTRWRSSRRFARSVTSGNFQGRGHSSGCSGLRPVDPGPLSTAVCRPGGTVSVAGRPARFTDRRTRATAI